MLIFDIIFLIYQVFIIFLREILIIFINPIISLKRRLKEFNIMSSNELYMFKPYTLLEIDYRSYRGLFNEGIHKYPPPRSGHRIVCDSTHLFCFGGYHPNLLYRSRRHVPTLLKELWKYNIFTRKWTLLFGSSVNDFLPKETASNAVVFYHNMIMVFGGTGFPFGEACSNKCYVFLPYTGPEATKLLDVNGELPPPHYGQAIVIHDKYLYCVGGTTGFNYSCDVFRLNLLTKTWECIYQALENKLDSPKGRYRHGVAYHDNLIYIFGGGTSVDEFGLDILPAYDIKENVWRNIITQPDRTVALPGYPAARKCHSCVQYTNCNGDVEIIITGGYANNTNFFDDIWRLNLTTLQWQLFTTAKLPYPLYFHDAATSGNGLMYVFGGIESSSLRTNKLYQMWTTIPKLSEICWESLLHYIPRLPTFTYNQLLTLGIPVEFARRIDIGQPKHIND